MATLLARNVHVRPLPPKDGYTLFQSGNVVYAIWETGEVWNVSLGKYATPYIDKDGYSVLAIGNRITKLHRLMLFIYVGPPTYGNEARHLDGDPSNNTRENLAWGTSYDNWDDRKEHGRGTGRAPAPKEAFQIHHHKRN